jgi:RimJ/RimL family protein N-acetyltransferase
MPKTGWPTSQAPRIALRAATLADARFFFGLRNDPTLRANSFRSGVIAFADHRAWLGGRLGDPERRVRLFVVTAPRGEREVRMGQIRFDCDLRSRRAEISISLVPSFRGRGLATPIIERALPRARPFAGRVLACIKLENEASLRAFLKANFRRHGGIRRKPAPHVVLVWRG